MKRTVLITAYAVNPNKGSEDGIGWNIIRSLAARNDVVAITRVNNRPAIEEHLLQHPLPAGQSLRFEYFDLPRWLRFWKKGGSGASVYHILWHFGVVFFILKNRLRFDLAHHLNFNADWSPSFLYLLGKPFVWGPVGHHHKIPRAYILPQGKKAWLKDRLAWWVKCYFWKIDPLLKLTKWSARRVIGLNTGVFKVLKVPAHKQIVIPAAASEMVGYQPIESEKFQVLCIGRFVPLKGFDLAIRAFARSYHRQTPADQNRMLLTLIGQGSMLHEWQALAQKLHLPGHSFRFLEWMDRAALGRFFDASKVFLFPSHEGAGMVVPEALSHGLPVLCFDNHGPGEFVDESCAFKIKYSTPGRSVEDFSVALDALLHDEWQRLAMSAKARERFLERYTWEGKARQIEAVYQAVFAGGKTVLSQKKRMASERPKPVLP